SRMVCVRLPCRTIMIVGLIAPSRPPSTSSARKQFEEWAATARLDDLILLIRLARMLALACRQQIHLPPAGSKGARVLAAYPEQDQLSYIPEIEADAS